MNRQGLIKLLQSNLSDEDVLEILKDIVCIGNKGINTDGYRPTYQPYIDDRIPYGTRFEVTSQFGDH